MANVKVFQKQVKYGGKGHKVKNCGTYTNRKVSPHSMPMCNMKTQSIMVQKRWSRLIFFFKSMSNVKVKVMVKSFGTNGKVSPQ